MSKLSILIFVVFIGLLALFAVSNKEVTTVAVPFGDIYEVPKISLILFSAAFGGLSILLMFLIRDMRRFLTGYKVQKKQKKEDRLHRLYSSALNAILADNEVEAKSSIEKALEENPEYTDALLRAGDIEFTRGAFGEAVSYYRRALSSSPRNLEALFSLAKVMETTGTRSEALGFIEEILDIDPDNLSALYRKRSILELDGKWDELIDVQKSILKYEYTEKEKQREQSNLLGYKYEQAKDSLEREELERANKEFRAILRMERNFIPAYLGLAETMLRQAEPDDAVNFLEKAYEQTSSAIILARLEDELINIGEPSRIIRVYKTAISNKPEDNMLRIFLGKLYYRLEMIEDAFETLKAIDAQEPYPELCQLLGELYLRRQQYDKAVQEFRKTMNMKKALRLPYCCGVCGYMAEDWSGRCPGCSSWNTFKFNLHGTCKV
ncbi:MAG: tetratricopeptide repeat protein [Nitrospirae bacterium]|nr:tetratricopeptide repeat protein [Nitrospirota bacterium]